MDKGLLLDIFPNLLSSLLRWYLFQPSFIFNFYFRFWGTCAGLLFIMAVCCTDYLVTHVVDLVSISHFSWSSPSSQTLLSNRPQCLFFLSYVSMCSHCSAPPYEWEHVMFYFLFLCQFVENYGFQIHPCPYKGHKLTIFYGCIVFHGVYVPNFRCLVYLWWAFGLVPSLCYCKQCCSEQKCACVFITEWFIILWVYTQ